MSQSRRRRTDIGNTTKDLSSFEGWPRRKCQEVSISETLRIDSAAWTRQKRGIDFGDHQQDRHRGVNYRRIDWGRDDLANHETREFPLPAKKSQLNRQLTNDMSVTANSASFTAKRVQIFGGVWVSKRQTKLGEVGGRGYQLTINSVLAVSSAVPGACACFGAMACMSEHRTNAQPTSDDTCNLGNSRDDVS